MHLLTAVRIGTAATSRGSDRAIFEPEPYLASIGEEEASVTVSVVVAVAAAGVGVAVQVAVADGENVAVSL